MKGAVSGIEFGRSLFRNALNGKENQARLLPGVVDVLVYSSASLPVARCYRGWQRVFRNHLRRTEAQHLKQPQIYIFATMSGAKVDLDLPAQRQKAGNSWR